MSRITKWKLEKTKVKVVFRLQFHATNIPQTGWDKLFISFIPCDSGKATAKTTKASVRNGTCKWADPIYETTRLLQDAKSKQYEEKLYKLVVAMGSSRSSILGDATMNLAEYADALKPSAVSLPLDGCNSGTVLHVTVQLLTSKTGFREFEQQRELRDRGLQSGAEYEHDEGGPGKEIAIDQLEKVNTRVRSRDGKDLSSLEEEVGSHEENADSAPGFDNSSNTSESLYAEKHDSASAHEIDSLRSAALGDLTGLSHYQSLQREKGDPFDDQIMVQGTSDSVHRWASDYSFDNDLEVVYEENHKLRGSLELAESTIFELKQQISSLQSQANEIGIETQKFSHLLASEISSGEEMARDVSLLKSDCSKFKDDIERLKNFKMNPLVIGRENSQKKHSHSLQDKERRWLNAILSMENRMMELQNKAYLGFCEKDFRSFHSELEELVRGLQDIRQGAEVVSLLYTVPSERTDVEEIRGTCLSKNDQLSSGTELDLDLSLPESLLQHLSIPPLVSQETDSTGAIDTLKNMISDLTREVDAAKAEKETFARRMNQMECYYEALIQELEENYKRLLGELQNLRNEHSTCLYTISASKAEVESIRQDMSQKLLELAEERADLNALNKELERRATTSEAALRRARLNYSIAVDKLQKDLELLSSQVVSMFETNENLIKQAFSESSQDQNLGPLYKSQCPEDSAVAHLLQQQNLNAGVSEQPRSGDIVLDDLKKSLSLQEELYQKVEEELGEMQFVNLHLDIFSKTLQETLLQANTEIGHMKDNFDKLENDLELSNQAQDQLIIRLQAAMEDIRILNEDYATCISKFSYMAQQNQTLEAKLEIVTEENSLLAQKVAEFEAIMMESRSYKMKYEACCAEKLELSDVLKQENIENVKLCNEISLLNEELKMSKAKGNELALLKDNLQEDVSFVKDNLASLLISYDQQFKGLNLVSSFHCLDLEANNFKGAILMLEEMQHNACNKILELMEENKNLDGERVLLETSLSTARADILSLKQKFKSDIQKMVAKLDASNALIEKLQFNLETVDNKIHLISEGEEKNAQQNKEFSDDLARFEVELEKLTSKGLLLAQKTMGIEHLAESCCLIHLQTQLSEIDEYMLAADVKITFLLSQYENIQQEFVRQIKLRDGGFEELQKRHHELGATMNQCLVSEAHYREENAELMTTLESLRSDLEAFIARSNFSSDAGNVIRVQLEECKEKLEIMEAAYLKDKDQHALQVEQLKTILDAEKEIDYLTLSKEELETTITVLKGKIDEHRSCVSVMEEYKDGMVMLPSWCNQLSCDLSEQVEELKNLSVHFKELKDEAEAERDRTYERREPEGPTIPHEPLRIAFSRELYEKRVQEMTQQLFLSKELGEESEAATKGFCGINEDTLPGEDLQQTDEKSLDISSAHLNTMNKRSSTEHLDEELQGMKNEEYLLQNDHHAEADLQVLQGELTKLHNENDKLRNIFPLFDENSSGRNEIENLLAFKIELAESEVRE